MSVLFFAVAFVSGACLMHSGAAPVRWDDWTALLAFLPLAGLFVPRRGIRTVAAAAALFAAGFLWADFRADLRLQKRLPQQLVWKDIVVEGQIADLPRRDEKRTRFDFDIQKIHDIAGNEIPSIPPLAARISDYHRDGEPHPQIRNGARLQVKVRLRPPAVSANPHGFEYADFLFARDIQLLGYVRDRENIVVLAPGDSWRESLRERIMKTAPPPQNGLLAAFVVGDRSGISHESYEVLRRAGIAHLVSVSGAHIALAAGFAALLTALLWRRSLRLTAMMPAGKAALLAALPLALGYALLAGFGVPVRRSFLMLALAAMVVLSGRTPAVAPGLAIAALVIVFADPWAAVAPGFWMSFALVAAVVAAFTSLGARPLWRFARMQALISVFAIPLTLLFFNEASLASPVANFIAVPVVGFAVLPMALADVFLPGDYLWKISGLILENLWGVMRWMSGLRFAAWSPAAAPWWLFAAAAFGGGWILSPAGFPFKWAGLPPIAALLLWNPPPPENMQVVFLNAGQGTAAVVRAGGKTLVYDAGPPFAGRLIVAPFLRGEGARKVDALVVSHDDSDHRGGAADIMRMFPVGKVFASFSMDAGGAEFARCEAGKSWRWGEVEFVFLHPHPDDYGRKLSDNEMSCVLKAESPQGSVLLTGDIPEGTELALAERAGGALSADVLLAAHHGSRYSTTDVFLGLVSPQKAVFTVGANNRFGHPHADALSRAENTGAEILRTDLHGAIIVDFLEDGIQVRKWRTETAAGED